MGKEWKGRYTDYCLIISSTHILCSHREFWTVTEFSCSGTAQLLADGSQYEVESMLKGHGVTLYKLKSRIEANSRAEPITVVSSKPQPGTEVTLVSLLLGEGDSSNRKVLIQTENVTLIPPDKCNIEFSMGLSECSSHLWIKQSYDRRYTYRPSFLLVQGKLAGMLSGGADFFLNGDRTKGFVNVARMNGSIEYPRDD
ncbi:hypothetical protein QAD02_005785 [Eretmocerus hayati]|uniref:Uncharacterized protein n=1 Tax=Eretmocerus hayati TaxID=131215 RepID=A0ACC2NUJ4_9HYME|nr:hypothetical protein QAD02_005785 [Eretmocerus hayati]